MKRFLATSAILAIAVCVFAQSPAQSPTAPAVQSENQPPTPQQKPLVIPDKFTNLMVLPKDISKPDLLNVMKLMTVTAPTGRCTYCHAVSDDLTEGNLALDDKPTKVKARKMIAAILEIDQKYAQAQKN
jgi:hypothetical protein